MTKNPTDSKTQNTDDLFEFPCEFPLKVMGNAAQDFEHLVIEIVRRHCQEQDILKAIKKRTSSGGKYMSITITIIAQSRAQLDALYTELSSHERVKMML